MHRKEFYRHATPWLAAALLGAGTLMATAAAMTVQTARVKVKGQTETVLTNGHGMTLYYSAHDPAGHAKCTGKCAKYWPPLVLKSGKPTGPSDIAGHLSVIKGADGRQVAYKGHPLYTFISDQKPGQANGEGVGGYWHAATPQVSAAKSSKANSGKSSW